MASEDSDIEDPVTEESDTPDLDMEDSDDLDSSDESDNNDRPSDDSDFRRPLSTDDEEELLPEVTNTDKDVFGNFTELCSELNLNEPLYPGCNKTTLDALSDLSMLGKKHNMSKKFISTTFNLLSKIMPENNTFIPEKKAEYFDKMNKLFHNSDKENVKFVCINCKKAYSKDIKDCPNPNCNTACRSKLVMNDLESILKSMFEKRGFAQILESQVDCFTAGPPLSDAQNVYKDLPSPTKPLSSFYDLQLIHNSNSIKSENEKELLVWSHLFVIRNLPPLMRPNYVVAGALISAKKNLFCEISKFYFNEKVIPLLKKGLKWRHPVTKLEITSKISIIATTSGDPQVERTLHQLECTNACKMCDIGCSTFKLSADHGENLKNGQTVRGYLHKAGPLTLRTHFPKTGKGKTAAGGKGKLNSSSILNPSALLLSKDCPIITNSSPDYLGSSVMGVVKKWTLTIINEKDKEQPDKANNLFRGKVDARMKKFRVPPFTIKPSLNLQPFIDENDWTPREFRDWLLFFSLPCLHRLLPKEQLQQHGLLVESIYLLLKSEVTEIDRKRAGKLLTEYSKTMSNNFPNFRSMNLHKHLHFAESVKHLGPLWAHSSLIFCEANDTISSTVSETSKSGLKPAGQIAYAIDTLNDSLSMQLLKQVNKMKTKPNEFRFSVPISPISTEIENKAVLSKIGSEAASDAKPFGFCKVGDLDYSSQLFAKENRSDESSYFVAYEDPRDKLMKHALVTAYILGGITTGHKKYFTGKRVMLKEAVFKTSLRCYVSHIRKYTVLEEFVCEEVKCLRKPLYHMGKLLAEPPNMFEIKKN